MDVIKQKDTLLWFLLNGILRQFIVRGGLKWAYQTYVVNEYPKSGGSWLGQMISAALNLPFPRNQLPVLKPCIMHGHYLHTWNIKKAVIVWRDGRDVLISQYYHSLFKNNRGNSRLVDAVRRDLPFSDYTDIKKNLPTFIEYCFKVKKYPRFSWTDFVDAWANKENFIHVKYEELRKNTKAELKRSVHELTGKGLPETRINKIVDNFSFEKQSGRKPGKEKIGSFLRKGIIGDWKNYMNIESRKLFDHYGGRALIRLGYEKDQDWCRA
jgi:hypothetical protein